MASINLTAVPGEAAIVAIATLITSLADGQTPDEKAKLWDRYIALTDPWQKIAVQISTDVAGLVNKLFGGVAAKP
jgi:hypothetical protein